MRILIVRMVKKNRILVTCRNATRIAIKCAASHYLSGLLPRVLRSTLLASLIHQAVKRTVGHRHKFGEAVAAVNDRLDSDR